MIKNYRPLSDNAKADIASYEALIDRQFEIVKSYQEKHNCTFDQAMKATDKETVSMHKAWQETTKKRFF